VLFIFGLGCWWQWSSNPCSATGQAELVEVLSGATMNSVAEELKERRLIRSASAFCFIARTRYQDSKLLPGEYYVSAAMSPESIIYKLLQGPDVQEIRVTIPEGYNSEQIVDLLVKKGLGSQEDFTGIIDNGSFPYSFLQDLPAGPHHLEGFLFPDTYFFNKGDDPREVINSMLQRFDCELTAEVQKKLAERKISVMEWVTLGSLVEKEAKQESDRSLIASVFFNRLHADMPLQSCATIQFILGTPKSKLSKADLQIASPYNTYLHNGLPPWPIASPGHASLQAVLQPAQSDYLYFLAKSDGYHVFAKTFEEHLVNQKTYQ
jgi:UPF0755 protein